MRHSTLLTSALAVGGLALPQSQLDKRQQATVFNTVTVTRTVFSNPYATPAWAGPPKNPDPPNPNRPPFAPSLPVWTPPHPDAGRTSTNAPGGVRPSSTPGVSSSRLTSTPTPSRTSSPPVVGQPGQSTTPVVPGVTPGSTGAGTPSSIVGSAISNPPAASSAAPSTAPGGAPLDPGHISGVGQASLSSGLDYQNSILYHHNAARANHGANPLVWNQTVANTAAIAANTCRFEHLIPQGVSQGQNLFTVSGNSFNVTAGITESWYKGEFQAMLPWFGQPSLPDDVFHNVGHLTQVLWKGTTSVGCVSIDCGTRMVVGGQSGSNLNKYTVCNYWPAGNVGTQYAINVGNPISRTNLGSWSD